MMQISDVYDRLALYEKTFELCMRADPQLTAWIQRVKSKGPPKPLMEGNIMLASWNCLSMAIGLTVNYLKQAMHHLCI